LSKHGIVGTYHHGSDSTCTASVPSDFRYTTRKSSDSDRANENLLGAVGKRLTYRRTASVGA
jgi:hypothetical protein